MTGVHYFVSILLGTFVLEDLALATALGLVASGKISFEIGFLACFIGITLGDLALYGLGRVARHMDLGQNKFPKLYRWMKSLTENARSRGAITTSVVVARFLPGARLAIYFAAGFLRYSAWAFTILTLITVLAWVGLAFALGHGLKGISTEYWIGTALAALAILKLAKFFITKLLDPWERKTLLYSWRQLLSFEFWPATFFYLPIVPLYIFLGIKYRDFLSPFYSNPLLENGGIIGESKWEFLKRLNPDSPHVLPSILIRKGQVLSHVEEELARAQLTYPFILKPDVGQRGYGVRVIRDRFELVEYLRLADFDVIAQALSRYQKEAGIFYVRRPSQSQGQIFSITDKVLPSVIGDGATRLGDLILQDKRARIIASTYFERHRSRLDEVLAPGEIYPLAECGNHCQGAIFFNGEHLNTRSLLESVEVIAQSIPGFYFGRIDVRYHTEEALRLGLDFEIVEVNGASSEATHIWDASTSIVTAYRTLFTQWNLLFSVGQEVKRISTLPYNVSVRKFFAESYRVYFRKNELSRSS